MDQADFYDLIPAYALDALDPAERQQFEARLATDPEAQRLLAEYRRAADALVLTVPARTAPTHLTGDLRARLAAERPTSAPSAPRPLLARRVRWMAPALAAVLAVALGIVLLLSAPGARVSPETLFTELVTRDEVRRVDLVAHEVAPNIYGELVAMPDGQSAVIKIDCLPPLPPEQTYELWVQMGDQIISGGTFEAASDDAPTFVIVPLENPLAMYRGFFASIEPQGGSPLGDRQTGPNVFTVQL